MRLRAFGLALAGINFNSRSGLGEYGSRPVPWHLPHLSQEFVVWPVPLQSGQTMLQVYRAVRLRAFGLALAEFSPSSIVQFAAAVLA